MAQRFPVPNTGNNVPPQQRYTASSVPPNLRQYSGPNFPVSISWISANVTVANTSNDRKYFVIFTDATTVWIHSASANGERRARTREHNKNESTLLQHSPGTNAYSASREKKRGPTHTHVAAEAVSAGAACIILLFSYYCLSLYSLSPRIK